MIGLVNVSAETTRAHAATTAETKIARPRIGLSVACPGVLRCSLRMDFMMWCSLRWLAMLAAASFPAAAQAANPELFTEITGSAGLVEKPPIYPDGRYMTPEITPGGVALLDYNND